tara:strand:+ start:9045 stop:13460 length:4416 start_codon:yes stop_codon:yes gene_type:complete
MNRQATLTLLLSVMAGSLSAPLLAQQTVEIPAQPEEGSFDVLYRQARFWIENNRPDLAEDALKRVLAVDAKDPEALFQMARLHLDSDPDTGKMWAERLRAAAPDSPQWQRLSRDVRRTDLDPAALQEARELAQAGSASAAIAHYDALFGGDGPPEDLALEYYQTLAGVDGRWEQARRGLTELARQRPQSRRVALALAETLTFRDATREQGIKQLEALWKKQPGGDAVRPWRQALVWLPTRPVNAPLFSDYLSAFPGDADIEQRRQDALNNTQREARDKGFAALSENRDSQARDAFQNALKENPEDAEALGGLGVLQLRAGQFEQAEGTLTRAIKLDPDSGAQWRQALDSARFYRRLAAVRAQKDAGQLDAALQAVRPLTETGGDRGRDARLLQGDILLAQDRPAVAETLYNDMLSANPSQSAARAGLVRALLAQQRYADAEQAFNKLPASEQQRLGYVRQQGSDALRAEAQRLIAAGQPLAAEAKLREAVDLSPQDPWVRLDLARRMQARGQVNSARAMLAPLTGANASPDGLLAAALLASEQQDWARVQTLIERIPSASRDQDARRLLVQAARERRVKALQRAFAGGDRWRVDAMLDQLYNDPPEQPATLGRVANLLVDQGEDNLALVMVRRDLAGGLSAPAEDYVGHVMVFSRTGREQEAQRLFRDLERRAGESRDSQQALDQVRRDLRVARIDSLRQRDQLAQAYDEAVLGLNQAPEDNKLLLALGRVYQKGELYEEAGKVYQYLLERPDAGLDARRAAVDNALAAGDADQAEQLLREAAPLEDSELLLLAARTARAQGDKREALDLAARASDAEMRSNPAGAPPVLARNRNPFRDGGDRQPQSRWLALTAGGGRGGTVESGADSNDSGVWLPGQSNGGGRWQPRGNQPYEYLEQPYQGAVSVPEQRVAARPSGAASVAAAPVYTGTAEPGERIVAYDGGRAFHRDPEPLPVTPPPSAAGAEREQRIDDLRDDLHHELATRAGTDLALRNRAGEAGLSQLTEVRTDLRLSGVPMQSGRFEATVSPTFLNAGALSDSAAARFGTAGPGNAAVVTLDESLAGIGSLLDQIDQSAINLEAAQQQLAAAPDDASEQQLASLEASVNQAQLTFEQAADRNLLYEVGIDLDALPADQRAFVDSYLQQEFGSNDFSLDNSSLAAYQASSDQLRGLVADVRSRLGAYGRAAAPDTQTAEGLGVSLAFEEGDFRADIGSTPVGFERTNLVGGLRWSPSLGRHTRLSLTAERRAVTDSLLSYAGVKDPASGETWGAVTRSGGEIGLSYDDQTFGSYGSAGLYHYEGHNVADNRSLVLNAGAYLRPIHEAHRTLQTGVHVNYTGFDDNLSQFTYGHGGYFSPQDYVSLAFPIVYTESDNRLTWMASISPGFQSYSVDSADIFPTRARDQMWLDILANAGVLTRSRYAAESESGFGLNLGAGLDYRVSRDLNLGTRIGYDTFGDYSETSALIKLDYTLEP